MQSKHRGSDLGHGALVKSSAMSNLQAFLLGIMVALTPSAIVMGLLLWRAPEEVSAHQFGEQNSRCDGLKNARELPVIPSDQPKNLIPDIKDDELYDAEYWCHRADELRAMAEQMTDTDTRQTMLGIASSYLDLAQRQGR